VNTYVAKLRVRQHSQRERRRPYSHNIKKVNKYGYRKMGDKICRNPRQLVEKDKLHMMESSISLNLIGD